MKTTSRRTYLDILRIIACFLVIFNHTSGFHAYLYNTDPIKYLLYIPLSVVTKIAVPIFFMISGSLLLSKDIDYKDLFTKRIPRIALTLILSSLVMYLISIRKDISSFSAKFFFRNLLSGSIRLEYWYLYAYLSFLFMLPFLRRIARQFSRVDFIVLLTGHFLIASFLPLINYFLKLSNLSPLTISWDFSLPLMTVKAFFYPLIGYYLDQVIDVNKLTKKHIIILIGVMFAGICIPSLFTYHQGIMCGFTQDYLMIFDYAIAICVFLLVKYWFVKTNNTQGNTALHRFICLLGSLTFGIYLMDPALKIGVAYFNAVVTTTDPLLHSVLWGIFSMAVCGFITFALKKLPIIKNLLQSWRLQHNPRAGGLFPPLFLAFLRVCDMMKEKG